MLGLPEAGPWTSPKPLDNLAGRWGGDPQAVWGRSSQKVPIPVGDGGTWVLNG